MEAECTHDYFFRNGTSLEEMCSMAECFGDDCCSQNYSVINLYQISWCWLGGKWYIVLLACIVSIFFIFRFVSNLVELYLAPAVAFIAEYFRMSEAMGAVTLLAFSNGSLLALII